MVAPLSRPLSQSPTWRPRAAAPCRRGTARGVRGSFRGPRERPPSARVPRRMTWCGVPGASSRACRGILALALRLESWGTPSELFLSVNNAPQYSRPAPRRRVRTARLRLRRTQSRRSRRSPSLTSSPSPIRCSHSRGRRVGLSRLVFSCLRPGRFRLTRHSAGGTVPVNVGIPLAWLFPAWLCPWSRADAGWPVPAAPVSNFGLIPTSNYRVYRVA
jgi:hypothetical protein